MLRDFARRTQPLPALRRTPAATDALRLERVASGDMQAFEALYRDYHPRLHRFLGLMASNGPLIEEVMNDTMLVVWKRAGTYNGACKVSTWIFAIAYRTALKALSRRDDLSAEVPADETASVDPGPEQRRSAAETSAALRRSLDGLTAEQRSVLVLTYFHDLPCAEIAEIVGCPVDTVKTRMFHGRRRLRALLSGELEDWL